MYKIPFIICLSLSSQYLYAQNIEKHQEILNQSICTCLQALPMVNFENLEACIIESSKNFLQELQNNPKELEVIRQEGDSLSERAQGELYGKKLMDNVAGNLIQMCDVYYFFIRDSREKSIPEMRKKYPKPVLDSLDLDIEKNPTLENLWERGNAYFAYDDLENAEKSYLAALELNPDYFPATLFLAWTQERKHHYEQAILLYKKALDAMGSPGFQVYLNIAQRKKDAQDANPNNLTCQDYRTGTFELIDTRRNLRFQIERNDSLQVETNLDSGKKSVFRVQWMDDCTYALTLLETNSDDLKGFLTGERSLVVTVEVIEVYGDSYIFSAEIKDINFKRYQKITRLE